MAKKDKRRRDSAGKSQELGREVTAYTDLELYHLSESGFSQDLEEGKNRILDLCCGKGMAAKPFKGEGNEIFYLDLSSDMIEAGKEEGYIEASEERTVVDEAENLLTNEKLAPVIGSFDAVVTRFSFHDFTKESYKLFREDKCRFYEKSMSYQKELLNKTHRALQSGGELQIIDTAVPPGQPVEAKELYNKYHMLKTSGEPIGVHIPKSRELKRVAKEQNLKPMNEDWYESQVSPDNWYQEGQVSRDRLNYLKELFQEASTDKEIKEAFQIETGEEMSITFPVIVLTLEKLEKPSSSLQ